MVEGMINSEAKEPSTPNEISSVSRETRSGSNDLPADSTTVRDTKVREEDDKPSEREESKKKEDLKKIDTNATVQAADDTHPSQLGAWKSASSEPKENLKPRDQPDHQEQRKIQGRKLVIKDKFHSYVQPMWQPKLTKFCTGLTGIKQETIDQSPTFPEMIKLFEKWLKQHGLLVDGKLRDKACWCTDGPDPYPAYLRGPVLNVKDAVNYVLSDLWYTNELEKAAVMEARYRATLEETRRKADEARQKASKAPLDTQKSTVTRPPPPESQVQKRLRQRPRLCSTGSWALSLKGMKLPKFYLTITGQLAALDLGEFQGQQHSGIDDAMNIARVVTELARRNVLLDVNEKPFQPQRFNWMGKPGQVFWNSKIVLE
ncbi:hypothetical protein QFC19_006343 [Naganishia cerealis]|uniref:Uncharacterized protein n=1 Tax=Naganishia cerealis TaxID=610337 RepID=A0ACC2VI36_9TREE|nr:hypothetical protein QFC19_006343 [Naganishia cerealis]